MGHHKRLVISLIFLLLIYASVASAAEPSDENRAGNIDDIAKALGTYFPKVSGKITAVDQDTIVIQSKNEAGLADGVLLSVYREGEVFYHPVTHVVLGNFEEETALLEVTKVEQGQIRAKVIQTEGTPQASLIGHRIRLTATRIPIGISAGVAEGDRYLLNELRLALEETGRFAVKFLPPLATLEDADRERNLYSITFTSEIARVPLSVKVQMQNVKTGKVVSDMESTLQASNETDSMVESLQYQLFEKQQKGIAAK